jgi:tRNA 5-methylaminomethyl-2-thiouridine biosynthesis bifunctional protein
VLISGQPPALWRAYDARQILDTCFGTGLDFLTAWQTWQRDSDRPPMLHYVALTDQPTSLGDLLADANHCEHIQALADELAAHWHGLQPGFHRFSLNDGRVLLTLCVGELSSMLRQQHFLADVVHLKTGSNGQAWDRWLVKALVRCCRRGTRLFGPMPDKNLLAHLVQCGFALELSPAQETASSQVNATAQSLPLAPLLLGQFNPHWNIKHGRFVGGATPQTTHAFQKPGTCAVIGAGLAGASVAAALARRGWQVQVLDAGAAPAAGASGLPAGLVVPHVSADDCTLSRLSRSGVRLMLQHARRLLHNGEDWADTGTLERRLDGAAGLAADQPLAGQAWSRPARQEPIAAEWLQATGGTDVDVENAIWHAQAAWLKPAQLVRAWLSQPGVTFQGHSAVAGLRREGHTWALLDATEQVLARVDRVVIANAMGAVPLMAAMTKALPDMGLLMPPLPALQGVQGQLSWGLHAGLVDDALPPFPVNGSGSLIPRVPSADGPAWFAGANYQTDSQTPFTLAESHAANLERLSDLLPGVGAAVSTRFAEGKVHLWQNIRCVTTDRLPLVGPLLALKADEAQSSVWLCAGMGSRGLTLSALCAELLAAQWSGEPLPVEASLAAALGTQRHARRSHKK